MKIFANLLLFLFLTFLSTPTIISVIEKSCDTSIFYTMSEEEETQKDLKVVFGICQNYQTYPVRAIYSSLIVSENLSRHDNISSAIFIPPPEA